MEDRVYPSYNNGAAQNNGYKGFNYNYPLQQPESPQTPRRGRRRCCVCCCSAILVIFLLLCIGAALVYFLMKPKAPTYTVQEATITQFNLTSKNHLNSDIKFVISAHNPNKQIEFFFGNVTFAASYENSQIGQGSIAAFQQTHKSTLSLPLQVRGHDVVLQGSDASDLKKVLSKKSTVDLTLKAKTNLKIKIGSLKSWKQKVKISCQISMAALTKPGKAQILSSSCKLKKP